MPSFSVTAAATAGFGVIARKPLAVVGWGLALVVGLALPALLSVAAMGPTFVAVIQEAAAQSSGDPDPASLNRFMQLQSGMMAVNLLYWLWSTFVSAVLSAAVFRAVLTPEQSAWAYLRVGSREMWLTLLLLVEQVLAMIVLFVVVLLVAVVAAIAGFSGGDNGVPAAIATAVGGGVVAAIVLIWLALRLSMALPMTFADNQFRLFESWSLTRGHALKLLGMALLIMLMLLVLEIVFGGVVFGLAVGLGGTMGGFEALSTLTERPPAEVLRTLWPWLAVWAVVAALASAAVHAIIFAPWAAAHRALTQPPA